MGEMLKRGGPHELIIRAARAHHCPICVQHSRHPPRPVAATQRSFEIDNFEWQHPRTKRKSRGTCIVCCFTHQPVVVVHETREPSVEVEMETCSAKEVIRAVTLRWLPYFGPTETGQDRSRRLFHLSTSG